MPADRQQTSRSASASAASPTLQAVADLLIATTQQPLMSEAMSEHVGMKGRLPFRPLRLSI